MQRLEIGELKAGYSVAIDVLGEKGSVLVAKNVILTDSLIKSLAKMSIESLYVHGRPVRKEEDIANVKKELKELEKRFECVTENKLMMNLKNAIKDVITRYESL